MDSKINETAIRKKLRSDAFQHPMTIFPSAVCILSIIYFVLLADILGGARYVIIIFICSAVISITAFFWFYSIRYGTAYAREVSDAIDLQNRLQKVKENADIKSLIDTIRTGFKKTNSTDGLNALTDLAGEYQNLLQVIEYKTEIDPLSIVQIPALAGETFKQGLNVLSAVLQLSRTFHKSDKDRIENRLTAIEREIKTLTRNGSESPLLKIKRSTAASYKKRLEMVNQQTLRFDMLLHQCTDCEASLHQTRIELAALKIENSGMSISSVIDSLKLTIRQVKEIQEEFKKLGY